MCVYSKLINKREREKRTLRTIRSTHQSIVKTVNDSIVILWKIILSREKERCAYFSCLSFKSDLWPLVSPVIVKPVLKFTKKYYGPTKTWLTLFIAIFLLPQFVHLVTIDSFIAWSKAIKISERHGEIRTRIPHFILNVTLYI